MQCTCDNCGRIQDLTPFDCRMIVSVRWHSIFDLPIAWGFSRTEVATTYQEKAMNCRHTSAERDNLRVIRSDDPNSMLVPHSPSVNVIYSIHSIALNTALHLSQRTSLLDCGRLVPRYLFQPVLLLAVLGGLSSSCVEAKTWDYVWRLSVDCFASSWRLCNRVECVLL